MLIKRQMMQRWKVAGWLVGVALLGCLVFVALRFWPLVGRVTDVTLIGSVLVDDRDPLKQVPIPGAIVQASIGKTQVRATTDETGYFRMLLPRALPRQQLTVQITHPSYLPLDAVRVDASRLCIARLTPTAAVKPATVGGSTLAITNARIRYTTKEEATLNVGSIVKWFQAPNVANLPCAVGMPCSPDKKWKATRTTFAYDAGDSNQFINIRASCVAGPCAFTQIDSSNIAGSVRKMEITVANWSDPATYLVEAEVSRTVLSDRVRESFPAIFGTTMDFTLPATAEGPSIEAELNGTSIVFPLGPNLLLSWATCTAGRAAGHERLFRCELKPGFVFHQK